ncbi:hypothetical protein lerEdw1_007187 [Lerista edwardsae]|nr:hypothetical protein lerEdw1_007187 [Lerista edwardsae]
MSSLSAAIDEFGLDLFKQVLTQNAEDNIFLSPMSIQAALAMVLYGARNETATQIEKVLHLNEVRSATPGDSAATEPECNVCRLAAAGSGCDQPGGIHSQFQALLSQLKRPSKDYDLSMASRLYGVIGFDFLPHYVHCLKDLYHAGLEKVDFAKATEKTRELINSWIESQTQGKIKDFYPPHSLRDDSVLVLVNAVYFKGKWEHRFRTENTKEAPFWVNKYETRNVPVMVQTGDFKIADIEDPPLRVLELPYKGKDRSMILLLPKDEDFSLEKLASSLTSKNLEEWTDSSKMYERAVNVHLPRFKLEKKYDLQKSLEAMGMTLPFVANKADLSGMSQQPLAVSKVSHQAFVEVNEEGTEAAAATGVGISTTSAKHPIDFIANRSFIFYIVDGATRVKLFFGKCASP